MIMPPGPGCGCGAGEGGANGLGGDQGAEGAGMMGMAHVPATRGETQIGCVVSVNDIHGLHERIDH